MSPRSEEFMAEARERLEAARGLREGVDYAAARLPREEAERIVGVAGRFVSGVGELFDA